MVASTSRFWRRYLSARRSGVYSWASSTGSEGSLERAVRADRLPGTKPSAPERLRIHAISRQPEHRVVQAVGPSAVPASRNVPDFSLGRAQSVPPPPVHTYDK